MSPAAKSTWKIELSGRKQLVKALQVLGQADAPFMKQAFADAGHMLLGAIKSRAPGSMGGKTEFTGVKGNKTNTLSAGIKTDHPGAKSYEFGRHYWQAGGARVYHTPGQVARPFYGIKEGGAAIGAVTDRVTELLLSATEKEWERIGSEPEGTPE
jgi:hypothetical protein